MRALLTAAALSIGGMAMPAPAQSETAGATAVATVRSQGGDVLGQVTFQQVGSRVSVRADLRNLAPAADFHGFHVHANGVCEGDFTGAGGHWNPNASTHGDHAGDMPVLYANADGVAKAHAMLDAFTVEQLLNDAGGVAVIVHAGRDNYANVPARYSHATGTGPDATTLATGDAGGRLGCGVIGPDVPAATGGYWMAGSDGGVFTHGDATFHGSEGARRLNKPVVALAATPGGGGYYLAASDGGIFTHGDAAFAGSAGSLALNAPIVGMAVAPGHARADIVNQAGAPIGTVTFTQTGDRVRVRAVVTGLAPASEFHGFHVHSNGSCAGDFVASAGGHWNPGAAGHGDHQGDLPVLYADANGVARADYTTDTFTVEQMLTDAGGVAVIVHAGRDNYANVPARYSHATGTGPDATTLATGDAGGRLGCGVVSAVGGTSNAGYWLAAADGGVFAFGDAPFAGSAGGSKLNAPVVGIAPSGTGSGYWLVASDGGVFSYGDAAFFGSAGGIALTQPIVAMLPTPTGAGYVLVARDGGVFTFGDATFAGSTGAMRLNAPIVGGALTETGHGYWLFAADGGVFSFGDAGFLGSQGATRLNAPVVAGSATA